ncbi:MAG: HGxxPAAW family protein, partial [Candidatus Limnocylindrales bacterium]
NTPAAWTAVSVAMLGFVVGGVALMLDPISMPIFWVGIALGVASLVIFAVMAKMGLNE